MGYYRHPQYGRVYGKSIGSPKGRIAWPSLLEKRKSTTPDGTEIERYEATLCIAKDDPKSDVFLDELNGMIMGNETEEKGMLATFNEKTKAKLALDSEYLKDGDLFNMEKYPYYKGMWILQARSSKDVGLRGPNKEVIDGSQIVGGCICKFVVTPHLGPTGLSFALERVQFLEDDGVHFGGAGRNLDQFLDDVTGGNAPSEETEVEEEAPAEEPVEEAPKPVAKAAPSPAAARLQAAQANAGKKVAAKVAAPAASLKGKSPEQVRAELRAQTSKVVTTGKGKNLAMDNL